MQLACGRLHSVAGLRHDAARSRGIPRAAADRAGSVLPQAQILERALADEPRQSPSGPMKAEQVARFLDNELRQLFRTGVRRICWLLYVAMLLL